MGGARASADSRTSRLELDISVQSAQEEASQYQQKTRITLLLLIVDSGCGTSVKSMRKAKFPHRERLVLLDPCGMSRRAAFSFFALSVGLFRIKSIVCAPKVDAARDEIDSHITEAQKKRSSVAG